MQQPSADSPPQGGAFRHEACFYASDEEFLTGTVPFVLAGIEAGDPVLVALIEDQARALREALGAAAVAVRWIDMAQLARNPARILPAWADVLVEYHGAGKQLRVVGQAVWPGRREAEIAEGLLHEALMNLAGLPQVPVWLRCPYDAAGLEAEVIDEARRSHPEVVHAGPTCHSEPSTSYAGAGLGGELFRLPLPEPSAATHPVAFGPDDIVTVRRAVAAHAAMAGVGHEASAALELAIAEVAANSVHHGGGRGSLRLWRDPDALVCEIRDDGLIDDPLVGRSLPDLAGEGGRGVWLANQLCDLVQFRSGPFGTAVRIWTWLPARSTDSPLA